MEQQRKSIKFRIANVFFSKLPPSVTLPVYLIFKFVLLRSSLDGHFGKYLAHRVQGIEKVLARLRSPVIDKVLALIEQERESILLSNPDVGPSAVKLIEFGGEVLEDNPVIVAGARLIYYHREQQMPAVAEKTSDFLSREDVANPEYNIEKAFSLGPASVVGGWLFIILRRMLLKAYHEGDGRLLGAIGEKVAKNQLILRRNLPTPSRELKAKLDELGTSIDQVRLMTPDWAALIGHLGHLDVHLRMRRMGWWSGFPLIITHHDRIPNRVYLSLFNNECPVLIKDENVSSKVWLELCGLNKYIGHNHQVWGSDQHEMGYWNDAAAIALKEWDDADRGYPLREQYDQIYLHSDQANTEMRAFRKKYGMADGEFHVCLHMRESGSRGETEGRGETIRNSRFDTHTEAIRYITNSGGWVIRMGGPQTPPAPKMKRVIDYAHSDLRSPLMDLHLVRTAKFFMGGASGFAYVATSFGVPSAMVNAISCISYLWQGNTRFAYKPVRRQNGELLSQRELTSDIRWSFPTFEAAKRAGYEIGENTPDEVLETVREVERIADGKSLTEYRAWLTDWRRSLTMPAFFGASNPSQYFFEKNRAAILGRK